MSEDSENPPAYHDPPNLAARMLTCRTIWFDNQRPDLGFSMAGIYTTIDLPEGMSFPYSIDRIFAYIQLWGDEGEYFPSIRLVRIESGEDDEVEIAIGKDGLHQEFEMLDGRPTRVDSICWISEIGLKMNSVPFNAPGLYEFQLLIEGIEEPVTRERVLVRS